MCVQYTECGVLLPQVGLSACLAFVCRGGPGNIWTPFVNQMFQHFGKFGDWSWRLCYLFCLRPTDYARLSQQCLMCDVAAHDKWYQWEGYVVRKLRTHLGSNSACLMLPNIVSIVALHMLEYAGVSHVLDMEWSHRRRLSEKINLSWGTHLGWIEACVPRVHLIDSSNDW